MQTALTNGEIRIFAGSTCQDLVDSVCRYLRTGPGKLQNKEFSDGEFNIKYEENIRNKHVVIFQATGPRKAAHQELMILIDAARRSAAGKITVVIPYFGYSRQERKDAPRRPISAKVMAKAIDAAGANWLVFLDLHAAAIAGFFETPSDHIYARPVFLRNIRQQYGESVKDLVLVAPDVGAGNMCRSYAKRLNVPIAILDKRRPEPNMSEVMNIVGDVKQKHALLIDDMVDTAGTLTSGAKALLGAGALTVSAIATHGILSGAAVERISKSALDHLFISDSIPLSAEAEDCEQISVWPLAELWANALRCIQTGESLSALFDE
ncbi:MAG: ribose-phosphate diphosphokinase [Candidatus Komeilibacteria bacterium]|nr:ribose-phosphate diphosphokinase [Candidatus Komeilibacteria bacterium]